MKKDVVAGLGEIGSPILKLFSKTEKESKCPGSFLFRMKNSSNKGFK